MPFDILGPGDAGAAYSATTTTDVTNVTSGDTYFKDCVGTATPGTDLISRWTNRLLQQARRIIRLSDITLSSNADDDMLGKAIQSGALNSAATFGGSANALTATLSPVPTNLTAGLVLRGIAASANTGAATINVNGLGAVAITRRDGNPLVGGEIKAGVTVELIYNGTNFVLASGGMASGWIFDTPTTSLPNNTQTQIGSFANVFSGLTSDSTVNASAGSVTIGARDAGVYVITGNGNILAGADTGEYLVLFVNGTAVAHQLKHSSSTISNDNSASAICQLFAGDVVTMTYQQVSGGTLAINAARSTSLAGFRLGN